MTNDNKKTASKGIKKLHAHVTYLEMNQPPARNIPVPSRPKIALLRAENIPAEFYSYLYELVGKPHHWEDRRNMAKAKLEDIINNEQVEISVLYADGCPAGFFELDTSNKPHDIEIRYLGLAPNYQSSGIGKWLVSAAISSAWAHKPEKVKLETNTLDHPSALGLYQKLGFSPVATADFEVSEWQ